MLKLTIYHSDLMNWKIFVALGTTISKNHNYLKSQFCFYERNND
jgi:hypothetical protein